MVMTREGAVAARAIRRFSDTEFMSKVKGAPWNFKANVVQDVGDDSVTERTGDSWRKSSALDQTWMGSRFSWYRGTQGTKT